MARQLFSPWEGGFAMFKGSGGRESRVYVRQKPSADKQQPLSLSLPLSLLNPPSLSPTWYLISSLRPPPSPLYLFFFFSIHWFLLVLKYRQSTVFLQVLLYSKVTQAHTFPCAGRRAPLPLSFSLVIAQCLFSPCVFLSLDLSIFPLCVYLSSSILCLCFSHSSSPSTHLLSSVSATWSTVRCWPPGSAQGDNKREARAPSLPLQDSRSPGGK